MSTYTPSLGLELITPGSQAGLWGNTTNNSLNLIDQAITGVTPINFASASGSTYTLTDYNGAEDESRAAVLNVIGTATGANTIVIPNKQKTYLVRNNTSQDVTFQTPSPTASYTVGAGYSILIFCDGNNNVFTGIASPGVGTLSVNAGGTGATTFTAGFVKSTGGTNALTSSSTVNMSSEVTGTLPVANGGTGAVSLTSGALLVGNGTGTVASLSGGVAGYVPTWNGSTWVSSAPPGGVSSVSAGTGISVSGTSNVTVTNTGVVSVTAGTGISITGTSSNPVISASSAGVSSFSAGTTGFTPSSSTTGAIVLGGTLGVANGGTGNTTGTATDSSKLGGVVAANYALLSGTSTITVTKTASTQAAFSTTGGGLTSYLGPQGLSIGASSTYIGGDSTQIALGTSTKAWTFSNATGNGVAVNGSWINGSDRRIKENIVPVTEGLSTVAALNPVKFSYKDSNSPVADRFGLIAQELEQVVPDAVYTAPNEKLGLEDFKSVAYTELVPILIKAIQELKAEVDALKAAK